MGLLAHIFGRRDYVVVEKPIVTLAPPVELVSLEQIALKLVPKLVDESPEKFTDHDFFRTYCETEMNTFLKNLPEKYRQGMTEETMPEDNRYHRKVFDKPERIRMGFQPDYKLFVGEMIECPTFDLYFNVTDRKAAETIGLAAVNQFSLEQADLDSTTLKAFGYKGEDILIFGLDLLRLFLPKGTKIQTRYSHNYKQNKADYLIS